MRDAAAKCLRGQLRPPASIAGGADALLNAKVHRVDHDLDCTARAMEHQPATVRCVWASLNRREARLLDGAGADLSVALEQASGATQSRRGRVGGELESSGAAL